MVSIEQLFMCSKFPVLGKKFFPHLLQETQWGEALSLWRPQAGSVVSNVQLFMCFKISSLGQKFFPHLLQEKHYRCGAPRPGVCRRCRWCSMAPKPPPVLRHTSGGADLRRCAPCAEQQKTWNRRDENIFVSKHGCKTGDRDGGRRVQLASPAPHGEHSVELCQVLEAEPQERQLWGDGGGEGGRGCLRGQLHCHADEITGALRNTTCAMEHFSQNFFFFWTWNVLRTHTFLSPSLNIMS